MDIRKISSRYSVSPQIEAGDAAAIKAAGFTTVICNRPDAEVPPAQQADAIRSAVEAAGLHFELLPITHQTMTPDRILQQSGIIAESDGPVLAYCASGTRSTVIWALGRAGEMPTDDILHQAKSAGYDLSGLRPTIEAIAKATATEK
ncbi:TIGR01244 family sulfur transferase [Marivita sp. GX14005]|uniref:TIGR01244 family sulfur transferase n=1 Tax=Marivita sp. GX14005 TaxID=2942276 RepID=UPI0020184612|nr:TIGR01244 family sulfur transferase [Marivita sp. GX14005]MCL3880797.1 TIGR01244 family sulfur transferase [Marivita sp. GX14005]